MITLIRRLFILMVAAPLCPGSISAQAPGPWSNCRTDSLSTYNCASYYNGTVTLSGELKGAGVNQSRSIVATIVRGRVTCVVKGPEAPQFEGPGMLAVEHGNTEGAGEYAISVWCPEQAGERPDRSDSPSITISDQRAADYAMLSGKDAHESPDADAANGLTGTETITWALRRQ
jgi:hypothetical protein